MADLNALFEIARLLGWVAPTEEPESRPLPPVPKVDGADPVLAKLESRRGRPPLGDWGYRFLR